MSLRLSGLNPLAYIGVEPLSPTPLIVKGRAPTVNDVQNINIGTLWDYTYTNPDNVVVPAIYMLVAKNDNLATWIQLYPAAGSELTIDADVGNAETVAQTFTIAGGTNINTSAAGSIVTVNLDENVVLTGPMRITGLGQGVVQATSDGVLFSSQGTQGQVLIGSNSIAPQWNTLTAGANVTITNTSSGPGGAGVITIASSGGGGSGGANILCADGNTATPAAGILTFADGSNIYTTAPGAGSTFIANLVNSPNVSGTITAGGDITTINGDVIILSGNLELPNTAMDESEGEIRFGGNRWVSNYGSANTFVGQGSGITTLNIPDATDNTGVGFSVLGALTTGEANTGFGDVSMTALTTGDFNSGFGCNSLILLVGGNNNTAFGYNAGSNYAGAESSNVVMANAGTLGESNTIRIGTQGSGAGQQQDAYIAGVYNPANALSGTHKSVIIDSNGKLGGLANGTNGQILISGTGVSPIWANITAGAGIGITNTSNGITLASTGTALGGTSLFHTNGTDATENVSDTSITLVGSGLLSTNGSSHTVTTSLTNGSNGQVIIGGGSNAAWATLTSSNASIAFTPGVNTLDLISVGTGGVTYTLNEGTPVPVATSLAGTITIIGSPGAFAPVVLGQNITTTATGPGLHQVTISTNNSISLPVTYSDERGVFLINNNRVLHTYGSYNTFVGPDAGNYTLTGQASVGIGQNALYLSTTGGDHVAVGFFALGACTTGSQNTAIGYQAMDSVTSGSFNTSLGHNALRGITVGTNNVAIGNSGGANLTINDSNNIMIGNQGVIGDSNITRIGTAGTNKVYLGGVDTAIVPSPKVVFTNSTDLLGDAINPGDYPSIPGLRISNLTNGVVLSDATGLLSTSTPSVDTTFVLTSNGPSAAPTWKPNGGAVGTGTDAFMYVQYANFPNAFTAPYRQYVLGTSTPLTSTGPSGFDRAISPQFVGNTWTANKTGIWSLSMSANITNLSNANWTSCSTMAVYINVTDLALSPNQTVFNYGQSNTVNPGYAYWTEYADTLTLTWSSMIYVNVGATVLFYVVAQPDEPSPEPALGIGPNPTSTFTTLIPIGTFVSGYYVSA